MMMRFSVAVALLAVLWGAPAAWAVKVNTTWRGAAVKGYDVVAYFVEHRAVKGRKDFVSERDGVKWFFSSRKNLEIFDEDPEKYTPQYGGFCAYAMSRGDFAGIDPEAFTLIGEKLYLNYNAKIQEQWLQNKSEFIQQADQYWQELKGK